VPQLDPKRLVREGEKLLADVGNIAWNSGEMNGRVQFSIIRNPHSVSGFFSSTSVRGSGRRGDFPVSGFAVAHAIWMLDEQLDAADDSQPNIVERRITPALILHHYRNDIAMKLACYLDGPVVDPFLMRQNWRPISGRLPQPDLDHREMTNIHGFEVNRWTYLLTCRQTPTGREFRQKHAERVMKMARHFSPYDFTRDDDSLGFLFLDLDLGEQSLAYRYWPQFKSRDVRRRDGDWLQGMWLYLVRMDPVSTVDMYVDCWREARLRDASDMREPAKELKALPDEKRHQVIDAIKQEVERSVANIEQRSPWDTQERVREGVLRVLRAQADPWTDEDRARSTMKELRSAKGEDRAKRFKGIAGLLAHEKPHDPLVAMLAEAEEAELRLLVMDTLRAHPTPAHRAILQKLVNDSDPSVRQVAEGVAADLEKLAETPPTEFSSATHVGREALLRSGDVHADSHR
jgi:hypothetical protein